jgi:tetratricopeptide (TPR) repeat protein
MSQDEENLYQEATRLRDAGRLDEAIAQYRRLVELFPRHAAALVNLGTVLASQYRWEEAAAVYQQAAALAPNVPAIQYNLSNALEAACQWNQALAVAKEALKTRPDDRDMQNHLGLALYNTGNIPQAIEAFRRAIDLDPDFAYAHCLLAYALMLTGDSARGWQEYEWRWKAVESDRLHPEFTPEKRWNGADPHGRRIILDGEGGFGDAIQFFRYAAVLGQRGAKVIVRCKKKFVNLLGTLHGIESVIAVEDPLPQFDLFCPLFSLPNVMGEIYGDVPYVHTDPQKSALWSRRIPKDKLNVGLVWAGGPGTAHDRQRSMNLHDLAPLANAQVRFFSLQKGPPAQQARHAPQGMELIDYSNELIDWTDTAALIANLDLVIGVDTGVTHLAGALGTKVWTAIQFVPDSRWLLDRQDSPWYPTMRLFRQKRFNDWTTVAADLAQALNQVDR